MGTLDGRTAMVTGASKGIGRGICLALAAEGARVVAVSRTRRYLSELASEIAQDGGEADCAVCDVADRTQVIAAVQQTVSRFGGLDILVTAAQGFGTAAAPASSPVPQPVEDFDEQQWSYTLLTGPTTTLWAMQAAFPHLRASGHGRVITFGSGQALVGAEGGAAYNAAKEAVRALSRTAAREWGKYGITVNVVSPLITTDTTRDYFSRRPGLEDNVLADLPLRGMGEPTDVGALAVFLAGDGAKFITGMTIKIDSGKHMFA